jgi:hypothetical protein
MAWWDASDRDIPFQLHAHRAAVYPQPGREDYITLIYDTTGCLEYKGR